MQMSKLIGERLKEKPSEAHLISHIYLLKGGYIRYVGNGIFTLLPTAKRITAKIENIIRDEMNKLDSQEVLFPVVMPASLWKLSGRYDEVDDSLVRFSDRTGSGHVLGMTHEEAAVLMAKTEARTYTKYPFSVFQLQTKFRDEARSRGGLMRTREFTMKDAYSFHLTQEDLEQEYEKYYKAYENIYSRSGIPEVVGVASDTGMMGGSAAHEFMLLCDAGEDTIALCEECGYKANVEAAKTVYTAQTKEKENLKEVHTPGIKDMESLSKFLDLPESQLLKSTVFMLEKADKPVVVFSRGDYEINEAKLGNEMKDSLLTYNQDGKAHGLELGFLGPLNIENNLVEVRFDLSVKGEQNLVIGADKTDYHKTGFNVERDYAEAIFADLSKVNEGDPCPECGAALHLEKGVEVGNIFQLGTKYTKDMDMTYVAEDGTEKHPIMGCYGIGVGRLMASVVEKRHDEYGPIWPYAIAPWHIHICPLNQKDEEVSKIAAELYESLSDKYEVLIDDRDVQAGISFADADLLGVPIRVIVSPRGLKNGTIEIVTRDKSIKEEVAVDKVLETIEAIVEKIK